MGSDPRGALTAGVRPSRVRERLMLAQLEAQTLRLPLVEPDGFPFDPLPVTRAAVHAASAGAGRPFGLAALRMAFCGGYDLSDLDLIAEVADAVGLDAAETLAAAADSRHELSIKAVAVGLRRRHIASPPGIRIGQNWFHGFDALAGTSAFAAAREEHRAAAVVSAQPTPA